MIVCFDTNVWVSSVATRGLCADLVAAALAEHQMIVGTTCLTELRQVLRSKLRLPVAVVDEMEACVRGHASYVTDASTVAISGLDAQDCQIVAEAAAGGADVLVTGDQDLLRLGNRAPIKILSPREFWELLRSR